jgi:hypothetical protein
LRLIEAFERALPILSNATASSNSCKSS